MPRGPKSATKKEDEVDIKIKTFYEYLRSAVQTQYKTEIETIYQTAIDEVFF